MNILRFFTISALVLISLASCTIVTTNKVPGKNVTKIPKNLLGKYTLEYPTSVGEAVGSDSKTLVTIKATELIIDNGEERVTYKLGDSLHFSAIGEQQYLSLGAAPQINLFKLVKTGKNIHLFTMSCSMTSSGDFNDFFTNVKEIPGEPDENGNPGFPSYEVTIDEEKLDDYFESDLPMKDPFILKKR